MENESTNEIAVLALRASAVTEGRLPTDAEAQACYAIPYNADKSRAESDVSIYWSNLRDGKTIQGILDAYAPRFAEVFKKRLTLAPETSESTCNGVEYAYLRGIRVEIGKTGVAIKTYTDTYSVEDRLDMMLLGAEFAR